MDEIKTLVKKLLRKRPTAANGYEDSDWFTSQITYEDGPKSYGIDIYSNSKKEYYLTLRITDGKKWTNRQVSLSEKEYMEIKWTIESWTDRLEEELLDNFKEFVEEEPNSMDDLLNE